MSSDKHLVIIDGYGFVFRAFHSMPPLTRPDGLEVGAVYGFTSMIMRVITELKATHLAVVFDSGVANFRHDLYPEYKAHRPPAPENLIPQFPLMRDATAALNVPSLEQEGYEADDIIAALVVQATSQDIPVTIISSDKDLMQLVNDDKHVALYDAVKKVKIDEAKVLEKFAVTPAQVRDVLALMGDSSDNIPGVPGIGPKTAADLINKFGSLQEMYRHVDSLPSSKRKENLIAHQKEAELSYQLVGLDDKVALKLGLDDLLVQLPDPTKLSEFLQLQGFKSLVNRVVALTGVSSKPNAAVVEPQTVSYEQMIITTSEHLEAWVHKIMRGQELPEDIYLYYREFADIRFLALLVHNEFIVIKANRAASVQEASLFSSTEGGISWKSVATILRPFLLHKAVRFIANNALDFSSAIYEVWAEELWFEMAVIDDLQLMAYLVDGITGHDHLNNILEYYQEKLSLTSVSLRIADVKTKKLEELSEVELVAELGIYFSHQRQIISYLRKQLWSLGLMQLYYDIELPLVPVLAAMQCRGMLVDTKLLTRIGRDFAAELEVISRQIYELAGQVFNIGSTKQLGEVLFDKLAVGKGKKSAKSGNYVTDNQVLEELAAQGVVIADKIIRWRQLTKLQNTYVEALPRAIKRATGRVHTSFKNTVAVTGRLSSTEPNLQNIPIRTAEGQQLRYAFIAAPGKKLISADYSQIELRLLASIANVATLKQAFARGEDIHAATASEVFRVPLDQVSSELRRKAKAINFGIIYGQSAFGLAAHLGIDRSEAAEHIEHYFSIYPGIKEYMQRKIEEARKNGAVRTLFGRYCFTPMINSRNFNQRSFAERAAINAPLQGTAADIIKLAMVRLEKELQPYCGRAQMQLQVHDELLIEVDELVCTEVAAITKKVMQGATHPELDVPLLVNVTIGDSWGE